MSGTQRRVVVTGVGLVTPLGTSARSTFDGLLRGDTGTVALRRAPFFLPLYLSEDRRLKNTVKASMLEELMDAMPCKVVGAVREADEDTYYYDWESKESIAKRRGLKFAPTAHEPRSFRFSEHAVAEALRDALLLHPSAPDTTEQTREGASPLIGITDPRRVGVNIGMGIPSLSDVTDVAASLTGDLRPDTGKGKVNYSKINPFFVPKILGNMAAGATAIRYNCQGFIGSSVAACATGAHCIGESLLVLQQQQQHSGLRSRADTAAAFRSFLGGGQLAQRQEPDPDTAEGVVDVMICGATEACITPVSVAGFSRMRALSTRYNDSEGGPASASRPFDTTRDGFVMAEGAGILILEELEHARRRIGAYLAEAQSPTADPALRAALAGKAVEDFIYGEVRGFGVSSDAHHVAAPHPQGRGAEACLRHCLASAGVWKDERHPHTFYMAGSAGVPDFKPLHIGYVNAHATGTIGDDIELGAIRRVFGASAHPTGSPAPTPGRRLYVSSSKGSLGHLLGAAGGVEAAVALMSLRAGVAPPTANLTSPCLSAEAQAAEGVYLNAQAAPMEGCDAVISTSFGFGGINTALLFSKVK